MTGLFVFTVVMVLVAVSVVVKPDSTFKPRDPGDRLGSLRAARQYHKNRIRDLEDAPQTRAADIEDEEQILLLINTEIRRIHAARD